MVRALLLGAAAALSLAACATQTASSTPMPTDRDCFYANSVNGFNVVDDRHVRISAGPSRDYLLTTDFSTRDIRDSEILGVRSRTGWVCTGTNLPDVELFGGHHFPRHYFVTEVARQPEPQPAAPTGS